MKLPDIDRIRTAKTILLPKGRNNMLATKWLANQGVYVPSFEGRNLLVSGVEDKRNYALMREKDMAQFLGPANGERHGFVAFLGSDSLEESADMTQVTATEVEPLDGLRFALLSLKKKVAEVREKWLAGEMLTIGTSYAQTAKRVLGQETNIVYTLGGGVEVLPTLCPEIDAIFEVVDTGDTAKANRLGFVADYLASVSLVTAMAK